MECRPGSFPTPTQLLLSIFSTVVGSQALPVHSLVSAVSTIPCLVQPPNSKLETFPCYGQEQEHWQMVIIAPPPLPELYRLKFSLLANGQLQSRYAFRTSILGMFRDHQVNPPNPTEMMCHRGFRVEHCLGSIHRSIEGLMRLGKDWTLMLKPYLILSRSIRRRLYHLDLKASKSGSSPSIVCVQCVGFRIQSLGQIARTGYTELSGMGTPRAPAVAFFAVIPVSVICQLD